MSGAKRSPEQQYRFDHPARVRYYDVKLDEFRNVTEEDYQRIEARCAEKGRPGHIERCSQFAFDNALDFAVSK